MDRVLSPDSQKNLRAVFSLLPIYPDYKKILESKDFVLSHFQPVFSLTSIQALTKEIFLKFLKFEHNCHWTGLGRSSSRLCADMNMLRQTLQILLDENQSVDYRLNEIKGKVRGMGKNLVSAILLISHPDKYGVWNKPAEAALKKLGIFPKFPRGEKFGSKYLKINKILLKLRDILNTDLWSLDALLYFFEKVAKAGENINKTISEAQKDVNAILAEREYSEGKKEKRFSDFYERNPELRAATILWHGTNCQVCGFNFQITYGERGEGFIEVHHLMPVSKFDGEKKVHPKKDMAVLCSNCHRMIHRRRDNILSLNELKEILEKNRSRE